VEPEFFYAAYKSPVTATPTATAQRTRRFEIRPETVEVQKSQRFFVKNVIRISLILKNSDGFLSCVKLRKKAKTKRLFVSSQANEFKSAVLTKILFTKLPSD